MSDPYCHRAVVGMLLIHRGRIAVARRQKPPLDLAPPAGHVDPEDGLLIGMPLLDQEKVFRLTARREMQEETGFAPRRMELVLTHLAADSCHKSTLDGQPGGGHLWRVYAHRAQTISEPTLRDEPGGMVGWQWRSPDSLLVEPELEPIWVTLLTGIKSGPSRSIFDQ